MVRCGAIETTLEKAAGFAAEAQRTLGVLPKSRFRAAMMDAADYTVRRGR